MKTAQDYLPETATGHCRGGFNSRLHGDSLLKTIDGDGQGYICGQRISGWEIADKMIMRGEIYSKAVIDNKEICFKCFLDGDTWCCVGEDFINLQESSCYAFGDTRDDAIKRYAAIAA